MLRILTFLFSLLVVGVVASTAYVLTGNATSTVRSFADKWGAPVSSDKRTKVFTIEPGMSANDIGDELERRKLIRSAFAFRVLIQQRGVGERLEAGDYEISPSMSTEQVIAVFASGNVKKNPRITVVEGWRAEEIAAELEKQSLGHADAFMSLVHDPSEVPTPDSLTFGEMGAEGYLFPATYEWDDRTGVIGLVGQMLDTFDQEVDGRTRQQIKAQGLTLEQALSLAAIVEREAARADERPIIASVYLNRLRAKMQLQADPTVQYAAANVDRQASRERGYWLPLSYADLEINSTFNTYRIDGLPPAPICNPGLDSIRAVAEPADTDFLYFVARGDGSHAFARTAEEHFENIQRYQ